MREKNLPHRPDAYPTEAGRKFETVRGVVFGEMLNCVQHAIREYTLEEVIVDLMSEFSIPILYGFATGHTSRPNVIVPFGVRARLDLASSAPLFRAPGKPVSRLAHCSGGL